MLTVTDGIESRIAAEPNRTKSRRYYSTAEAASGYGLFRVVRLCHVKRPNCTLGLDLQCNQGRTPSLTQRHS